MRNRFVQVTRVIDAQVPALQYMHYRPVELRNGNLYTLFRDGVEMPSWRGYQTAAEAFAVIDAIEKREREATHPERCDCKTCRPELYV